MKELRVTRRQARRYLIRYHGLYGRRPSGRRGVLAVFERLKSLQYDPLDVVTRNMDLALQARVRDYRPATLQALLYEEHALIDGWDKMMCVYPAEDYARFRPLHADMERYARAVLKWRDQEAALARLDEVRAFIRENGPSSGADMPFGETARSRWGTSTAAGAALEYLFYRGELLVAGRSGTRKRYDFPERLLSPAALAGAEAPDGEAFFSWYVRRRICGVGLLWNRSGGGWLGQMLENKPRRTRAIEALLTSGALLRVRVEGIQEPFYCPSGFESLFEGGPPPQRVRFLAPLDNLLWDRAMIEALFDFRYTWEVYVPAHKRQYGYYVLPMLCGERFMGRFEPAPYRAGGRFAVKNLWLEEGFCMTAGRQAALDAALTDFEAYLRRSAGDD
ncbi:MAG: crosslink repair DNA glycosylase YcaQ family protein [Clostridia bacterium]|nr:crosslink repair DNA glycosylase YcaQ family protein [Clostridia bacterium]